MRQPIRNTAKLPQKLLEELGGLDNSSRGHVPQNGLHARRAQRKAAKVQKRSVTVSSSGRNKKASLKLKNRRGDKKEETKISSRHSLRGHHRYDEQSTEQPKNISPMPRKNEHQALRLKESLKTPLASLAAKVPEVTGGRLSAEDAEIAALERALGIKENGGLPKSFADDGLDILLNDSGDLEQTNEDMVGKRKRTESVKWLIQKRQKVHSQDDFVAYSSDGEEMPENDNENRSAGSLLNESLKDNSEINTFDSTKKNSLLQNTQLSRVRENPYKAPLTFSSHRQSLHNNSPSRSKDSSASENLLPLRRQIQGLLNRLSEANFLSILRDFEKLYQNHPRQLVSNTLLDLLMGLLCDPAALQDTFIILHAGFIAAVYKIIGTDFGAQVIQRIDKEFTECFCLEVKPSCNEKKSFNLISLLAQLFNFHVISSNLIYDYIRRFLEDLSEVSAELIMKVMKNSGPQLRQEGASALKDIFLLLQSAILKIGSDNLSVRTKFMVETMENLKNNRTKTGVAASTINFEHTIQMKRTLGALNDQSITAREPLRIGLQDIKGSGKRGRWWLIETSHRTENRNSIDQAASGQTEERYSISEDPEPQISTPADLVQFAHEQRMNTDVRRSIFIAIMSATDYKDAHHRLTKLQLKKSQELEIPKVLIHCVGAEEIYNPFYSLLSQKMCSDRKLRMAFQFSLWGLFKRMDEVRENSVSGSELEVEDNKDVLSPRSIVNLARMFGVLMAEDGIGVRALKVLNFSCLSSRTRTFVEILLISIILHSQLKSKNERNEQPLMGIFLKMKDVPDLAAGLRYFLKRVVSKTDIAGSKHDIETVKWGCKVVGDVLKVIVSSTIVDE